MKVFAESCKQSNEVVKCPLCRTNWGSSAVTELSREDRLAKTAPNVHRLQCKACKSKPIYGKCYRCIRCPHVDLCGRCFSCVNIGFGNIPPLTFIDAGKHSKHQFVVRSTRNSSWEPAGRGDIMVSTKV